MMKKTAYIINTARGGLIRHDDLYDALTNNLIQGVGLDVLENEPPQGIDRKIIELPNAIVTAHSAYVSDEASDLQLRVTSEIVGQILSAKIPMNIRNPQVIENIHWIK